MRTKENETHYFVSSGYAKRIWSFVLLLMDKCICLEAERDEYKRQAEYWKEQYDTNAGSLGKSAENIELLVNILRKEAGK